MSLLLKHVGYQISDELDEQNGMYKESCLADVVVVVGVGIVKIPVGVGH